MKITFNSNGGKIGSAKTKVVYIKKNKKIGKLPAAKRTGYTLKGWYTKKSGGKKVTKSTKAKKKTTFYARWTAKKYTLTFNPNGGTVNTKTKKITFNKNYGTLPTPKRNDYTFNGWYTSKIGGKKVTSTTKVTTAKNITVYAQWKKKTSPSDTTSDPTMSAPGIPTNFTSTANTDNVVLNWNNVLGATGYQIYRSTSETGPYNLIKTVQNNSFIDSTTEGTGLIKGTPYYYKLRAYKEQDGEISYGNYSSVERNGVITVSINFGNIRYERENGHYVRLIQNVIVQTNGGKGSDIEITETLSSTFPHAPHNGVNEQIKRNEPVSQIGQSFNFNRTLHLYNNGPQSSYFTKYTVTCNGNSKTNSYNYCSAKFTAGGNWGIPHNPGW